MSFVRWEAFRSGFLILRRYNRIQSRNAGTNISTTGSIHISIAADIRIRHERINQCSAIGCCGCRNNCLEFAIHYHYHDVRTHHGSVVWANETIQPRYSLATNSMFLVVVMLYEERSDIDQCDAVVAW